MNNSFTSIHTLDNIVIELISISKKLVKLLKKENELLEDFTFKSIARLQHEKTELMTLFEQYKSSLLKYDKEEILDKKLLKKLKNINTILQKLMSENKEKLSYSLSINYKVSELIKNIILINTNRQATYDKSGCYNNKIFEISPISFIEKNSI
ncbi:hypothetical protein NOVO_08225 [Rickettsiales bacterium Ac37b]|nr:hypothetical protein NOVO_08225 [Rickettsiales bacterium Ac37b]